MKTEATSDSTRVPARLRGPGPGPSPSPEPGFIAPLRALGRGALDRAGGKGANLGELLRAGFRVPDGFVVTTAAYDFLVEKAGLAARIEQTLRGTDPGGAALRSAIEHAAIPAELERAIEDALALLGPQDSPVAVRSSATAEDLPDAAFAGQQDTFLNVQGTASVLAAVRSCWASLWTERAIAYRARQGFAAHPLKLAVVVQRMVRAEVAGVMFTANPLTGARDQTVIDASPGLGEAVVSGLVTPDHAVLRRGRLGTRIVTRRPGRCEVEIRPRAGGGTEHVTPATTATPDGSLPRLALPDGVLRELARLGTRIERHFGAPQDIEWAWAAGTIWVLQARPMTALPKFLPAQRSQREELTSVFADMLSTRPYPMDLTVWGPQILRAGLRDMAWLGFRELSLPDLLKVEDGVVLTLRADLAFRPTLRVLLAPAVLLASSLRYEPLRWREIETIPVAQARVQALEARDPGALTWAQLLATVHEAASLAAPLLGEARSRYSARATAAYGLLKGLLWLLEHDELLDALLSGLETFTLATNRDLAALAAQVRARPALAEIFVRNDGPALLDALQASETGRDFYARVQDFIGRYGHREAVLFTLYEPTWKDAPEVVLSLVRAAAATAPRPEPARPAWEAARDTILALPALQTAPLRAAFLRLLAEARCFTEIREDTHFYGTLPMPVLRRTLLELGRRLTGVGVLDRPEDVFHLRLDEVERVVSLPPSPALAAGLREIMLRRRARRAALAGTPVVDPGLFSRPPAKSDADALVRGTPGSPGVVQGPARVIREPAEFGRLLPGDVLVAPFTNPAWTPLFQHAAAVVVDSGGASSHAAIVAREYGIPAVMGTGDATQRIKDGTPIRVDGDQGVVRLARAAPDSATGGARRPS